MIESLVLKAQKREQAGTRAARRLRKEGLVPAVIYGHKQEPVSVTLNYHDLALEVQHHHRLLEVELEGKKEKFLVKDVQYDYLGDTIIHVDLARVDLDERVQVTVGIVLKGTPVGVTEGGVLEQLLTEVEVECLVTDIPEDIRANVTDLKEGEQLNASQLELPAGSVLMTEADAPIAIVRTKVEEVEEEEVSEEAEAAEPEVITREKEEEESEDK